MVWSRYALAAVVVGVLIGSGSPASAVTVPDPERHSFASAVWDIEANALIVFGGFAWGSGYDGPDTWGWSSGQWSYLSGGISGGWAGPSRAYDPVRQEVVALQGGGGSTWTWQQSDGWVSQVPENSPPVLRPALAWDESTQSIIAFGGDLCDEEGACPATSQMWSWDGSDWTQLHPPMLPPARHLAGLVYSEAMDRLVLFGGNDDGVLLNDTWTWDGSTWTELNTASTPPARAVADIAYDPSRERVLLSAGALSAQDDYADTWELGPQGWVERHPAHRPPLLATNFAYAPDVGMVVAMESNSTDLWGWTGDDWVVVSPPTPPADLACEPGTTTDSAHCSWTGVDSHPETTSYQVTADASGQHFVVDSSGTTADLTGLSPGTTYAVKVRAQNSLGLGPASGAVSLTVPPIPPLAPASVSVNSYAASLSITWQPPADTGGAVVDHYTVAVDPAGIPPVQVNGTSAWLGPLAPGDDYTVTVTAHTSAGDGPPITAIATPVGFGVPGGLSCQPAARSGVVDCTWDAVPDLGATGRYSIGITAAGEPHRLTRTSTTTARIKGLTPGETYAVSVAAANDFGVGSAGAAVEVALPPVRVRPTVTARLSTHHTAPGRAVTLSGQVNPRLEERVHLQKLRGDRWRTISTRGLDNRSNYAFRLTPAREGEHHYRVFISSTEQHRRGVSRTRQLTVA